MATSMNGMPSAFHVAIERILGGWTALQLAVTHGFGGAHSAEKAMWMIDVIEQWFKENSDIESWELEDFVSDIMSSEFDTMVDDNSLPQICKSICGYFRLCQEGKQEQVLSEVRQLPSAQLTGCVQQMENEEEEEECTSSPQDGVTDRLGAMNITSNNTQESGNPSSTNQQSTDSSKNTGEDEDGWQVVTRTKKR